MPSEVDFAYRYLCTISLNNDQFEVKLREEIKMKPVRTLAKKASTLTTLTLLLASWASSANATYIVDTKIGQVMLTNSGDATELAAMEKAAGNANLMLDFKSDLNTAHRNPGTSDQWFIDVIPNEPGYFLLDFAIGGTNATANAFFFQNVGELTKLVWSDPQVQFLTGGDCSSGNDNACNIGRLKHYVAYNPDAPVPEPSSAVLFALGLLALTFKAARKGRK